MIVLLGWVSPSELVWFLTGIISVSAGQEATSELLERGALSELLERPSGEEE